MRNSQNSMPEVDSKTGSARSSGDATTATIDGFRVSSDMVEGVMVSVTPEQSRENAPQAKAILGRKQELNLQFHQLIDAVLFVVSLWSAYAIRSAFSKIPGVPEVSTFNSIMWLIILIMPFGPLFL